MARRANGIMLLGSVPRPPKNPKSSISTQSARHSTVKAMTAGRISRRCPLRKAAPITASATTTNRLTANPCASSKAVKALTQADRKPGCGVCAIVLVMPARVPGCPWEIPCQNPRPGQACSTAMPDQEQAQAGQDRPAEPGAAPRAFGQRDQPARARSRSAPRRGRRTARSGRGRRSRRRTRRRPRPPAPSPTLASPASRDNGPREAASSQTPIPTWIHTADAPACIG